MARNLHRPRARRWVIAWNLFGLADLAFALTLGATTSPGPIQLFLTLPTSGDPPDFFILVSILLHLISLRYLFSGVAGSRVNEKTLVQTSS